MTQLRYAHHMRSAACVQSSFSEVQIVNFHIRKLTKTHVAQTPLNEHMQQSQFVVQDAGGGAGRPARTGLSMSRRRRRHL